MVVSNGADGVFKVMAWCNRGATLVLYAHLYINMSRSIPPERVEQTICYTHNLLSHRSTPYMNDHSPLIFLGLAQITSSG